MLSSNSNNDSEIVLNNNYLKEVYNKLPESVKFAFSRPIHEALIKNHTFKNTINSLIQYESMSEDQKINQQLNDLKELSVSCYENSEFYRSRFNEAGVNPYSLNFDSYSMLPVLDKNQILSNYDTFVKDFNFKGSYESATGGSTGKRLPVVYSRDCFYIENAFAYYYYTKIGYEIGKSRLGYIGGDGNLTSISPLYSMIRCNSTILNEQNLVKAVEHFNRFKPEFIRGFPSTVSYFAELLERTSINLDYQVKGVFLQSENVTEKELKTIKRVFSCPISITYGLTERTVRAEFLEWNGTKPIYQFNKKYGYTEIVDNLIVGTGFINKSMPLLRYTSGDEAQPFDNGFCISGHRDSCIIGKNGERTSLATLYDLGPCTDCISGMQFSQSSRGIVTVMYLSDAELSSFQLSSINSKLNELSGNSVSFQFERVDVLQRTDRGKLKLLVSGIDS